MIVAFDTLLLSKRYRRSGIHEYAKNLFLQFRHLSLDDSALGFRHFVSQGYSDETLDWKSTPRCEAVDTKFLRFHRLWQLGLGSVAAAMAHADLIFSPGPTILPSRLLPVAVTIHDAMPAKLPSEIIPKSSLAKAATWFSAKWSRKILTDSEHSKRDLIEVYNLPPEKVSVVYLGYTREIFNSQPVEAEEQAALLAALGIRRPYILHHGMVQRRKNLSRLVQAYRILQDRTPDYDAQLVLAGDYGWGADEILQSANGGVTQGQIVFTGPLQEHGLAVLIKGAALCVIPSLYEGFCLPMMEAMACGVPTIASSSSCIPEISGGVLRYFDPLSEEEMVARMDEALNDTSLRQELKDKGLKRASEFSWERCAKETLEVLRECAA